MEKFEILDKNLTEEKIREIRFAGELDGYFYKDYEFISEIKNQNGEIVAKIHNNASEFIDE